MWYVVWLGKMPSAVCAACRELCSGWLCFFELVSQPGPLNLTCASALGSAAAFGSPYSGNACTVQ